MRKQENVNLKSFEDSLKLFPNSQKTMNAEQRKKASIDLTIMYLNRYYTDWRLAKILTNKKLLTIRYEFFDNIIDEVKQWDDQTGEATIAQEIQNGLHFDSIAQAVQYIEDLFALMNATKQPDFFIKNIITYNAGQVTNFIKNFNPTIGTIAKRFYIPLTLKMDEIEAELFKTGIDYLISLLNDIVRFYKDYEFFYNQYKHGLAVGLRPFGNIYNSTQINSDKANEHAPYLVVYDNLNINSASKKGSFSVNQPLLMNGLTDNVMPFISKLHDENNYLRLAFPPDNPNFNIEMLVDYARKTKACLNTFVANYSHSLKPEGNIIKFQLPTNYHTNEYMICSYDKNEAQ